MSFLAIHGIDRIQFGHNFFYSYFSIVKKDTTLPNSRFKKSWPYCLSWVFSGHNLQTPLPFPHPPICLQAYSLKAMQWGEANNLYFLYIPPNYKGFVTEGDMCVCVCSHSFLVFGLNYSWSRTRQFCIATRASSRSTFKYIMIEH